MDKRGQKVSPSRTCSSVHLCRERYTCKSVEKAAFDSHAPCYLSPYQGFSVCLLQVRDWLRIFWTIKSSYGTSAFLKTMKASAVVAADCRTEGFRTTFENALYSLDVLVWGRSINKDDELAHSIVLRISSYLPWNQRSTVDWYAFAANTTAIPSADQSGNEMRIQVIGSFFCESLCACTQQLLLCVCANVYLALCMQKVKVLPYSQGLTPALTLRSVSAGVNP